MVGIASIIAGVGVPIQNADVPTRIQKYSDASNFWSATADVCLFLVVAGVVGEIIELWPKILKAARASSWRFIVMRRGKIDTHLKWFEKHERHIDAAAFAFWIVVVVGLALELTGTRRARHYDELTIALLTGQSAESGRGAAAVAKEAGAANERASANEKQVSVLSNQTAMLVATNLALQERVTRAERDNLALYKEIQPRRIGPQQRDVLERELKTISKPVDCTVDFRAPAVDFEARLFATRLMQVLGDAGIHVNLDQSLNLGGKPYFGLTLFIHPAASESIRAVLNAFTDARVVPDMVSFDTNMPKNLMRIEVGTKIVY